MSLTPATRTLDAVLRTALDRSGGLRVLVGAYAASQPTDHRKVNVVIGGATVAVPNLNGTAPGAAGSVCYVLADDTRMWVLGQTAATSSGGAGGAATFLSGVGAPGPGVGTDGAIYLDTASGRMWGPKAAGAWPAVALGRLLALNPTYAQLTTG